MKKELEKIIEKAVKEAFGVEDANFNLDYASDEKFGDYATNAAMVLGKVLKKNPLEVAEQIIESLNNYGDKNPSLTLPFKKGENWISPFAKGGLGGIFEKIEIAPPGYINFYLSLEYLQKKVSEINEKKEKFGNGNTGKNKKVLLEFISSNPTGPIHLGNGRGGPIGDTLANVLKKNGFGIMREFYVNDFGNQVEVLGHSILKDEQAQYRGDYIENLAQKLFAGVGSLQTPMDIGNRAANEILEEFIKPTCEKLGIKFDNWFSEKSLHESGAVDKIISLLQEKNLAYEKDGAVWFKSSEFGDDKDRVVVKSDGKKTYVATDLAYHKNKIERNFEKLINIQGSDHHKEAEVVKNFVERVLGEKNKIDAILTQFVRIIKDGKEVKMSKRKGIYFAMDDLIEEVGADAIRFIFLSYSPNSHINFDINLAKERSEKNPVYYVQYAHARICSILAKSKIKNPNFKINPKAGILNPKLNLLVHSKESSLIKELDKFPELVEEIAESYEVHKLPHYAIKLADKFHSFYADCRVIDAENPELSKARLNLANAVRIVLAETLRLIGVSAPEKM